MVGSCWRAGVGTECARIPLVAAVVRRHGGERWPRHRPRAGNRPGNCPAAAYGGASVGGGTAGQRKARGARDRCGRTRYMALGSIRKRIQRLRSLLRASGPGRRPIGRNQMVGRPDFRAGRTTAPRCAGLVCHRLPRERQIEQRRVSGSVGRSRRILVARGGKGGRATQPASCDSRRAGRHRYSQARGDRTVSFCSDAWLRPRKRSSAGFRGNCTTRSGRR